MLIGSILHVHQTASREGNRKMRKKRFSEDLDVRKLEKGKAKYEEVCLVWAAWRNSDYLPSYIIKENFSKWIQIL